MIDIFEGSPRDKFYEILFNANQNLVTTKLDELITLYSAMRLFLESKGVDESEIFTFLDENKASIESDKNDIFIQVSGEILSQNE